MNAYYVLAIWAGMALLASLVSIRQLFRPVIAGTEKEEAPGAEELSAGLTSRSHTDHAGA